MVRTQIKPYYTTPDGAVSFTLDVREDGQRAYLAQLKNGMHLYVTERALRGLTSPDTPTEKIVSILEMGSDKDAEYILMEGDMTPRDFHNSLLQLRIKEQEDEIAHHLDNSRA